MSGAGFSSISVTLAAQMALSDCQAHRGDPHDHGPAS
jgi:hypothetical protein